MPARTRTNKITAWTMAGAAAVAGVLTAYSALTGDHHRHSSRPAAHNSRGTVSAAPSPAPTYTVPADWTEPTRWAALPRGKHTRHGRPVGFPHTVFGAVAMLAAASSTSEEQDRTAVDEQLAIFDTYISAKERTAENRAKVKAGARREYQHLTSSLGLPAGGDLPPGAYVRTSLIGYKVIRASHNKVSAYVLTNLARKAGELAKERVSYTVAVLAVEWKGGDWKLSSSASAAVAEHAGSVPAIAAPGDAAFNAAGWTAIRQAS
jgi:hypothetical protein